MSAAENLAVVLDLACLTEDRTNQEQDALLRVAARVDAQRNALVGTNKRTGPASRLYFVVAQTRDAEQPTRSNAKTASKLAEQAARWDAR